MVSSRYRLLLGEAIIPELPREQKRYSFRRTECKSVSFQQIPPQSFITPFLFVIAPFFLFAPHFLSRSHPSFSISIHIVLSHHASKNIHHARGGGRILQDSLTRVRREKERGQSSFQKYFCPCIRRRGLRRTPQIVSWSERQLDFQARQGCPHACNAGSQGGVAQGTVQIGKSFFYLVMNLDSLSFV